MSDRLKTTIKKSEKMLASKKNHLFKKAVPAFSKNLEFMPVPEEGKDLCQSINKNLFQLEKEVSYFRFAIKEIRDITKFSKKSR